MTIPVIESGAYQRDDGTLVVPRREFASARFDYKPGQHVLFAGPTQRGKTSLAFILLEYTATPELPVYIAVCKPTDKVTSGEGARLGYRRTTVWPPIPRIKEMFKDGKPSGYLIWPPYGNMTTDIQNAHAVTAQLIDSAYSDGRKGKRCILMLDDTPTKSQLLALDREMITVLAMAGAMGVGGWFFVQKPTNAGKTSLWSFSQSEHIFIARDPDKRNRERYNEIGGFDTKEVERICLSLKPYQFLYLERSHGYMCIVDSK
jgi:hypothetical protein